MLNHIMPLWFTTQMKHIRFANALDNKRKYNNKKGKCTLYMYVPEQIKLQDANDLLPPDH